jgi:hypothetical protein
MDFLLAAAVITRSHQAGDLITGGLGSCSPCLLPVPSCERATCTIQGFGPFGFG